MSTKSTHHQFTIRGCSYCQAPNHVFEECPVFHAQQVPPEHLNAAYSRPSHNPYSQTYNPGWRNHPNFSWAKNNPPRPNFSNNFYHPTPPPIFPSQAPASSSQGSPMEKKISKLKESIKAFIKSQAAFMQNQGQTLNNHSQAISRLEMQMSQLASSLSERPKGTLPSQPLVNPKTSNQAYEIQDPSINPVSYTHLTLPTIYSV